jgi:Cysteine-rich CPXCG
MNKIEAHSVECPYCGESIEVLIDCSVPDQNYIEDCQVCCCPINFDVTVDHEGTAYVNVSSENE